MPHHHLEGIPANEWARGKFKDDAPRGRRKRDQKGRARALRTWRSYHQKKKRTPCADKNEVVPNRFCLILSSNSGSKELRSFPFIFSSWGVVRFSVFCLVCLFCPIPFPPFHDSFLFVDFQASPFHFLFFLVYYPAPPSFFSFCSVLCFISVLVFFVSLPFSHFSFSLFPVPMFIHNHRRLKRKREVCLAEQRQADVRPPRDHFFFLARRPLCGAAFLFLPP